jgi:mannosyltransferase OCH1-like enzyme
MMIPGCGSRLRLSKACSYAVVGVGLVVMVMTGSKVASNYPNVRRRLSTTFQSHGVTITKPVEKIPKIIHQIYLGFDANRKEVPTIPEKLLLWRENCRFVHQDYEMRFWSKRALEALIQAKYEFLWETWQGWSSEWIKQADAARYILLHEFGGVYMDLDYSCETPVDSIIANTSLVLHRGNDGGEEVEYIDNSFMASTPNHYFWTKVMSAMMEKAHDSVLAATGPNMLHHVLYDVCGTTPEIKENRYGYKYHDPDVEKCGIKLMTKEMKDGVIRHHHTATWLGLYLKNEK